MAIFSVVRFEEREKNKYLLVKQCRKLSEDEYQLEGIEMKVGGFGSQNAETSITYPNIRDIPRLFFPKEEEVVKKKVEDYVEVLVILETIACSNLFMLIPKMSLPLFIIDDADVSFYQQSFDVFTKIASIEYLKQHGLEERANLIQHYIHLLDFREALQKPLKSSTDHRGNITVQGVFDRQMLSDVVQFVTEKELRSSITIKKSEPTQFKVVGNEDWKGLKISTPLMHLTNQLLLEFICYLVGEDAIWAPVNNAGANATWYSRRNRRYRFVRLVESSS